MRWARYSDGEGIIHFTAPPLVVNAGLCGNDDSQAQTDNPVTCRAGIAVVRHVFWHGRPPEADRRT